MLPCRDLVFHVSYTHFLLSSEFTGLRVILILHAANTVLIAKSSVSVLAIQCIVSSLIIGNPAADT